MISEWVVNQLTIEVRRGAKLTEDTPLTIQRPDDEYCTPVTREEIGEAIKRASE